MSGSPSLNTSPRELLQLAKQFHSCLLHDCPRLPLLTGISSSRRSTWYGTFSFGVRFVTIFDDLFDAFGETGRTVLVCLSEGLLQNNKRECDSGEDIKVQTIRVDGSFCGLVFKGGSYKVGWDSMRFQTVLSYDFAQFKYHDLKDSHGFDDDEEEIERLANISKNERGDLPDISASEPDSWWLGQYIGGDWKEWYLVNFKKQEILVGPMGQGTKWPRYLDMEDLHFRQPEWVKGLYFDEDE